MNKRTLISGHSSYDTIVMFSLVLINLFTLVFTLLCSTYLRIVVNKLIRCLILRRHIRGVPKLEGNILPECSKIVQKVPINIYNFFFLECYSSLKGASADCFFKLISTKLLHLQKFFTTSKIL